MLDSWHGTLHVAPCTTIIQCLMTELGFALFDTAIGCCGVAWSGVTAKATNKFGSLASLLASRGGRHEKRITLICCKTLCGRVKKPSFRRHHQ